MGAQFSAWLNREKVAGRGGIEWPETIVRGRPFSVVLAIPLDVSGDTFTGALRVAPDAPGEPLVSFAVTVGAFDLDDVKTEITFALDAVQTGALPADGDGDGLAHCVGDFLHSIAGEDHASEAVRVAAFGFTISGGVA